MNWSEEEEGKLIEELSQNLNIEEISKRHSRSINSIQVKIRKIAEKMLVNGESCERVKSLLKLSDEMVVIITLRINNKILRETNAYLKNTIENMEKAYQILMEDNKRCIENIIRYIK